jgi:hypothetical protein
MVTRWFTGHCCLCFVRHQVLNLEWLRGFSPSGCLLAPWTVGLSRCWWPQWLAWDTKGSGCQPQLSAHPNSSPCRVDCWKKVRERGGQLGPYALLSWRQMAKNTSSKVGREGKLEHLWAEAPRSQHVLYCPIRDHLQSTHSKENQ